MIIKSMKYIFQIWHTMDFDSLSNMSSENLLTISRLINETNEYVINDTIKNGGNGAKNYRTYFRLIFHYIFYNLLESTI